MVTTRTDIRLWPKFTDRSFHSTEPVYSVTFLLPQAIIIEVSLYCCDKLANFGTNTHKPELFIII